MTTKVNGNLYQGSWFERDTAIVTVTTTFANADAGPILNFQADGINYPTQQIMRILQTRGTVIGYTVESSSVAHFLFGHASGAWTDTLNAPKALGVDVIVELQDLIDAVTYDAGTTLVPNVTTLSGTTLVEFAGFKGAVPAVVTHA